MLNENQLTIPFRDRSIDFFLLGGAAKRVIEWQPPLSSLKGGGWVCRHTMGGFCSFTNCSPDIIF